MWLWNGSSQLAEDRMTLDDLVAKVTDPYDRQARLYPALLCLLPLLALITLLYAANVSALTGVVTLATISEHRCFNVPAISLW